jgi:predicted dehydrogenase
MEPSLPALGRAGTLRGITVGCGFFGNVHLDGWSRIENARIVAVVDQDETKAKEAADQSGIAHFTDLESAIDKEIPDFVDIATRPDSHLPVARVAASKGCHVLCQKPIALTWEESVELVGVCEKHSVRLMINENWRWQPWYRQVSKLIESGIVGSVMTISLTRHQAEGLYTPPFPRQPYFRDMERFLLIESVIHLMDVARFLGGTIQEVFCDMRRVCGSTRGEDSVHVHLNLEGGIWGMIYSTRGSEPDVAEPICDQVRIEGTNGFIRLDRDGKITVKPLFKPAFEHGYRIPEIGYRGDSVRAALEEFVDGLLSGREFETEGEDYLNQVMRAVFAGYESAQTRTAVRL